MRKIIFSLSMIVGFFLGLTVFGAERHVSTTGNDSWPGTASQPWRTVRHAGATAQAGDIVYIHAGTYNDMLIIRNSGTAANRITFTNYPGEVAIIDGTSQEIYNEMNWLAGLRRWHGIVDMYNVKYITIKGLKIQNATLANGIYFQRAENLIIENNIVDNTYTSGIGTWVDNVQPDPNDASKQLWPPDVSVWRFSKNIIVRNNEVTRAVNGGWSECISFEGVDGFEITGNYVHSNHHGNPGNYWGGGGENIDCKSATRNGIIANNVVHGNRRIGIYIDAWDAHVFNIDIYNNLVYDITHAAGISIANEDGGKVSGIRVYNNLIYNTKDGIILPDPNKGKDQTVENVEIFNNTVVHSGYNAQYPGGYGFKMDNPQAKNIKVYNNIFADAQTEQMNVHSSVPAAEYILERNLLWVYKGASANSRKGTNPIEANPLFLNPAVHDYRLQSNSPAINAANPALVVGLDFDNKSRPQAGAYDVGAFEHGGVIPIPLAPSSLGASSNSGKEVYITWVDNSNNETGFKIERKTGSGSFSQIATTGTGTFSYTDDDRTPSTQYSYRVRAYNSSGNSAYSNEASATTLTDGAISVDPFIQDEGNNGIIAFEAEHHTSKTNGTGTCVDKNWYSYNDANASQNLYMMVENVGFQNAGNTKNGPAINYKIKFVKSGTHYIWARVITPNDNDDSANPAFNGTLITEWHMGVQPSWTWIKCPSTFNASAGEHTFSMYMREDGVKIDKFVLTTNPDYSPTGTGPAESPQGAGGGDTQAPSIPSGLAASNITTTSFNLSWSASTDNVGVNGYEVIRGTTSLGTTTSTSMAVSGLSAETTYSMKVRARDDAGNWSAQSSALNVTTTGTGVFKQTPDGLVSMEAESFTNKSVGTGSFTGLNWTEYSDGAASGDKYMVVPGTSKNANGSTTAPVMNYKIDFVKSGKHYMWMRVIAPTLDDDSSTPAYNGTVISSQWGTGVCTSWTWKKSGVTFNASPGEQTYSIYMREDGLKIDKIVLTTSNTYTPTGEGPSPTKSGSINMETTLEKVNKLSVLEVYPNPANSAVTVKIADGADSNITLFNSTGMVVLIEKATSVLHTIDVSSLNHGLYYLKVCNAQFTAVKTLVVR